MIPETLLMPNTKMIMIVDDDEDDREIFCEAVTEIDDKITCVDADNGENALKYLKNENNALPDFIFLDLNMPRLNGKECLVQIKKLSHLSKIPVVIYSTSNHPSDKKQTMELGADGFVHKHTEFNMLCTELRKWLV